MLLSRFLFGAVRFDENQEYAEFQYKFLCVLMLTGGLFTAVFLATAQAGVNPMDGRHLWSMRVFTTTALVLWWLLRGRQTWFLPVAWMYEVACLWEYTSALLFVPEDELRVLWFYINVPGVYILLGQRAGLFITGLTVVGLLVGNAHLAAPYSVHALMTSVLSLVYFALFFHVYGNRSLSYFARMQSYNRRLQALATRDGLTGLLNARAYHEACTRLLAQARRDRSPCAVLFIDLDHFKRINDQHGHLAGDRVLQAVAQCVQQHLRESDVLGRIGGEEFCVFLPHTDVSGASQVAEDVRARIEALMPEIAPDTRLRVTASIGLTSAGPDDHTLQAIQHRADEAMYQAKQRGRNQVSVI